MARVRKSIGLAGLAATLVLAFPVSALAQDGGDSVRLSGAVRFASDLPTVQLTAPALDFGEIGGDSQSTELRPLNPEPLEADQSGTATALAWYERFTVAPSESYAVWGVSQREFQLQGGNRWGVTIGYTESDRLPSNLSLDDISAGAFYDFSERFRFGGELRFTSPEEEMFGEDTEQKQPELRFESAFRF